MFLAENILNFFSSFLNYAYIQNIPYFVHIAILILLTFAWIKIPFGASFFYQNVEKDAVFIKMQLFFQDF